MKHDVRLVSVGEDFTALQEKSEIIALANLFIHHDLLTAFSNHLRTKRRPATIKTVFEWVFDNVPSQARNEAVRTASKADAPLTDYFRRQGIGNTVGDEKRKVSLLGALVLELCVGHFLSQRLKDGLERDVKLHVNQEQVGPTQSNLDFGYVSPPDKKNAEFYECKTRPSDLFQQDVRNPYTRQLQLLMNIDKKLKDINWDTVCAVPTFLSQSAATNALHQVRLAVVPVGVEHIPELETARPVLRRTGWVHAPGL